MFWLCLLIFVLFLPFSLTVNPDSPVNERFRLQSHLVRTFHLPYVYSWYQYTCITFVFTLCMHKSRVKHSCTLFCTLSLPYHCFSYVCLYTTFYCTTRNLRCLLPITVFVLHIFFIYYVYVSSSSVCRQYPDMTYPYRLYIQKKAVFSLHFCT
jgi:hypothetical protein